MKIGKRVMRGIVLLTVLLTVSMTGCDGDGGKGNGISANDYSGTYYVTLGPQPRWIMVINQNDNNVTFAIEGGNIEIEGTGTVSDNTMNLTAEVANKCEFTALITFSDDGQSFSGTWEITGDNPVQGSTTGTQSEWYTYDVDANGIPQFVGEDCIELAKIRQISKFRSGAGHDFSDDFESCRSMKHYFIPKSNVNWSTIKVFSPVNGTVISTTEEWDGPTIWKGTAVSIKSEDYEAFHFIIFHVNLNNPLNVGDIVTAGQELGKSAKKAPGTALDIAVGVNTPTGYKLVSYFDVMTDSLFLDYQARGLSVRDLAIISREERDGDPLACDGEEFVDSGTLENRITLN